MVFNYRFSNHSELFERVVIAVHVLSIFFPHLNPCGTKRRHQRSRMCGTVATCGDRRDMSTIPQSCARAQVVSYAAACRLHL